MQKRVIGFVMSSDTQGDKVVHKVRIRDEASDLNGEKCVVMSIHDNVTLSVGLDVSFLVATAQERGRTVLKAMDVQLHTTIGVQSVEEQDTLNTKTINIMVTDLKGKVSLCVVGIETEEDAKAWLEHETDGEETLVSFLSFSAEDVISEDVEIDSGFDILKSLTDHPSTRDVIESLLTSVFNLGQRSS